MSAWRQITGWRAVAVLLGAVVILVAVLSITMTVIEQPVSEFAAYTDILAADSVEQAWLPPFLPRDAVAIREVHDLDTDERWIAFKAPPSTLRTTVRDWVPLSWPSARASVQDRPWRVGGDWPPELSRRFWHTARSTRLLSYHRDAATGWCIAVEWGSGRAWGWTCERVG
jgi:hypothetical protein